METSTILIVLLTSITAYFIKGVVGFGPSLIIVPVLGFFIDFKEAVVIATLADICSSGIIYLRERKKVQLKNIAVIIIGMFFGTFIGVNFLSTISVDTLKRFFGIFLIIIVMKSVLERRSKTELSFNKIAAFIVGAIGGICGGLFNTNGPPVVYYLNKVIKDKKKIRANLSAVFIFDAIWRAGLFAQKGMITTTVTSTFGFLILPGLIAGLYLGNLFSKKAKDGTISTIVNGVLLFVGGGLIFAS